jgi:hypothetical protein
MKTLTFTSTIKTIEENNTLLNIGILEKNVTFLILLRQYNKSQHFSLSGFFGPPIYNFVLSH